MLTTLFIALIVTGALVIFAAGIAWYIISQIRLHDREGRSLNSSLLLVKVSRSNEVKIDAMEQIIASLYSIKKGGFKMRFSTQPVISFEIVARLEDIKFYVWTFNEYRDMIEKQIHGAYQDAEILEVP